MSAFKLNETILYPSVSKEHYVSVDKQVIKL